MDTVKAMVTYQNLEYTGQIEYKKKPMVLNIISMEYPDQHRKIHIYIIWVPQYQ